MISKHIYTNFSVYGIRSRNITFKRKVHLPVLFLLGYGIFAFPNFQNENENKTHAKDMNLVYIKRRVLWKFNNFQK